MQGKTQEFMGKHGKTRGYIAKQKNRGKKRSEEKIWQNFRKTGGYIRKHGNKWEYRESIGEQGTTTTNNVLYYTNTNEIPGEHENLISSHENNMLSSHVSPVQYHLFYGYLINRAFHNKKLFK